MQPFEQVVREHGPAVLRVCRAVVGPVDAEDAWSETFLAALRAYPALGPDANVQAWLVTIAHRKAIDVVRARARRAVPVEEVPPDASPTAAGSADGDLWGRLPAGEHDDALWAALAALPTKQRQAVAYHYVVGLPHREVAAITGGSTDAARRAAADGIKALRRGYAQAPNRTGGTS